MTQQVFVGSRVRVTNPRHVYSGYRVMAELMGISEVWREARQLPIGSEADVIRVHAHEYERRDVYALKAADDSVVIMDSKGFEVIGEIGEFAIGSKVKVISEGRTYDTYRAMAVAMGVTDKWKNHNMHPNETVGVVVAAMQHEVSFQGIIYAVEAEGKIALIGERGLEQYVEPKLAPRGSTFPVGTKVRVKLDIIKGRADSKIEAGVSDCCVEAMLQYAGREGVIESSGRGGYQLDITHWSWLPDWLELVPELTPEQRIEELEAQLEILRAEKAEIAGKLWLAESKLTRIADIAK